MTTASVGTGKHTFDVIEDWAKVPEGWNAPMAAVALDSQDRVYGFNRGDHRVIVFDRDGNYLYDWGEGMFPFPHAIYVDPQDNVWIVERNDCQIFKFTPKGELLMTIGEKGHRSNTGADPNDFSSNGYRDVVRPGGPFNLPAGVAVAPDGKIFISDGYANCQVHRFSAEGKHEISWGAPGGGPGEFLLPHGIWIHNEGQVLVADRENNRVQVFTQEGEFVTQWPSELIGPVAFWEDDDAFYVPEHNSGNFSILDKQGKRIARWGTSINRSCHGVWGDSQGDIYFVQPLSSEGSTGRRIVKYVRK
jgi:DNA-binding beta-propeller fold protein YncE